MYLLWILLHSIGCHTIFIFRLNLFQIDIILFSLHLRIYCTHVYMCVTYSEHHKASFFSYRLNPLHIVQRLRLMSAEKCKSNFLLNVALLFVSSSII